MKTNFLLCVALPLIGGCLSPAPQAVNWTIGPVDTAQIERVATPKFGTVRLSPVEVRAPFDAQPITVLRGNGSVAFDSYNVFSVAPATLLRGVSADVVSATGLATQVIDARSLANADQTLEITVTELALDCRTAGPRTATVSLAARLVESRTAKSIAQGSGTAPAEDGNFSKAFAAAYASALSTALKGL